MEAETGGAKACLGWQSPDLHQGSLGCLLPFPHSSREAREFLVSPLALTMGCRVVMQPAFPSSSPFSTASGHACRQSTGSRGTSRELSPALCEELLCESPTACSHVSPIVVWLDPGQGMVPRE